MDISIKELLTGVEKLGLDTQALRDFQVAGRSGQLDEKPYKHILATLQDQVNKALSGKAEPAAVRLLLNRLDKRLQIDLAGKSEVQESRQVTMSEEELRQLLQSVGRVANKVESAPETVSQTESPSLNEEILHQLRLVNEEVKQLKDMRVPETEGTKSSSPIMVDNVFVNPIDEDKVKELKANVTIEERSKKKNLKDKINRLKELKREKEG
jgi:hypothetical protein